MTQAHNCREAFSTLSELMPALRVTAALDCLSAAERRRFERITDSRQRLLWLGGRRLAKRLLCTAAGEAPVDGNASRWHIESRDAMGRPCRPRIYHQGRRLPWKLSISHCNGALFSALSTDPGLSPGVDVTALRRLPPGFGEFWFSPLEQELCRDAGDPCQSARIWASKEAAYKAANRGESFVPRQWPVQPATAGELECAGHPVWLKQLSGHITALILAPALDETELQP